MVCTGRAGPFEALDRCDGGDAIGHPNIHEHAGMPSLGLQNRHETFIQFPQPIGFRAFPASVGVVEGWKAALHELLEFVGRQLG
jgi:hypothetical protein